MQKYLALTFVAILFLFASCKKIDSAPTPGSDTVQTTPVSKVVLANLVLNENEFAESAGYFIATDRDGNILADCKYQKGQNNIALTISKPYAADRFDLYKITIPATNSVLPQIVAFMGTKKGSTYTSDPGVSYNPQPVNITPNFTNIQSFDELWVSSDWLPYDSQFTPVNQMSLLSCTPGSKIWVQAKQDGVYKYNLFDVPQGAGSVTIPLDALTKTSLQKTISCPGTNLNVTVTARKTATSQETGYFFGGFSSAGNSLVYHYPAEDFGTYSTNILYTVGNLTYNTIVVNAAIPDKSPDYDATFNPTTIGSSMMDFKPGYTGTFDYYAANFINQGVSFVVYAPSAANATSLKFPDLSKYITNGLDYSKLKLSNFGLYQNAGFNESNLPYGSINYFINSKSVAHHY